MIQSASCRSSQNWFHSSGVAAPRECPAKIVRRSESPYRRDEILWGAWLYWDSNIRRQVRFLGGAFCVFTRGHKDSCSHPSQHQCTTKLSNQAHCDFFFISFDLNTNHTFSIVAQNRIQSSIFVIPARCNGKSNITKYAFDYVFKQKWRHVESLFVFDE